MIEPTTAIATAAKTVSYVKTANEFWNRLQPTLRSKIQVKIQKQFKDFSAYLDITNEKTSTVQLICSRSVNSKMSDVYVPCKFSTKESDKGLVSDVTLISDIREGKRVVVRGNGGSGKTLFMKNLWRDIYQKPEGKIPVFIELRKFNDMDVVDVLTLIRYTLSSGKEISKELFHEFATDGSFLLIFDGFDEVSLEKREDVERQLLDFEQRFKKCCIVISSRPNETFIGWKAFHIHDVEPFTREQILELIENTPLDKVVTSRFKKLISNVFYERYYEFLSSPLLALMMLVTFKQKAEIADNIIDFYDNAFHALYSEHDAIKEAYRRPHCLSINEFRLVFSTFCMFTYYQEKFELSETEIREYILKSINHVNLTRVSDNKIKCTVDDFLHEVLDAVNLMRKDGLAFLFIHRSFQEFFAAYWVIVVDSTRTNKLLEDFALRASDNVLSLAYQMNKVKVDETYILPFYDRLVSSGMMYETKRLAKSRWQYVEGYALQPMWRLLRVRKSPDKKELIPYIVAAWGNGEVGIYYTNLDALVFQEKLIEEFKKCMDGALAKARPSKLARQFSEDDRLGIKLRASVNDSKISLYLSTPGNDVEINVTKEYFENDLKYKAKLEGAFDDIEEMLCSLNETVNAHIAKIKNGHSMSKKNLDDMFF